MRFPKVLLVVGLGLASVLPGCGNRRAKASFTEPEAREKIGERVRCIRELDDRPPNLATRLAGAAIDKTGLGFQYANVSLVTLCEQTGKYFPLKKGDLGSVVDLEQVANGAYFLVVRWDRSDCERNASYLSRPAYEALVEKADG